MSFKFYLLLVDQPQCQRYIFYTFASFYCFLLIASMENLGNARGIDNPNFALNAEDSNRVMEVTDLTQGDD